MWRCAAFAIYRLDVLRAFPVAYSELPDTKMTSNCGDWESSSSSPTILRRDRGNAQSGGVVDECPLDFLSVAPLDATSLKRFGSTFYVLLYHNCLPHIVSCSLRSTKSAQWKSRWLFVSKLI